MAEQKIISLDMETFDNPESPLHPSRTYISGLFDDEGRQKGIVKIVMKIEVDEIKKLDFVNHFLYNKNDRTDRI